MDDTAQGVIGPRNAAGGRWRRAWMASRLMSEGGLALARQIRAATGAELPLAVAPRGGVGRGLPYTRVP